jgi:hypothetical protein
VCTSDSTQNLQVSEKDILSTYPGSETLLEFVLMANESTAAAMKKLINSQLSTAAFANSHLRPFLPEGAMVAAVMPAGQGVWPGTLSTETIIGILLGVVAALMLGAFIGWKFLQGRAKAEAQQMHFAVAGGLDEDKANCFSIQDIEHDTELSAIDEERLEGDLEAAKANLVPDVTKAVGRQGHILKGTNNPPQEPRTDLVLPGGSVPTVAGFAA